MRILEINTEKGWRGGEKQTLLTVSGLISKGHEVTLACKKKSALHKKAHDQNINYISIRSNFHLFIFLISNAKKFDLIHAHTAKSLTACVFSNLFHQTKVIFSRRHYKTPSSWFSKWKYNQADCITTVSEYIKTRLLKADIQVPIHVIYDASIPVKPNHNRIEKEYGQYLKTSKKIIVTVAAFEHEKDPFTLLEAVYKLNIQRTDFLFLHFGSGRLKDEIQALIEEKNLQTVYLLQGQTPNIEELYSMFDVFVMSSKNEGLGSSVIDAFLNKVPVVSTNAGGLNELVQNRGRLVPIGNADSLCQAMQDCLHSDNTQFIDNAYFFATTALSTEKIQAEYETLFTCLLANPTV
jgi:glycosyltransferase involved in cell wall biosynthesis